MRVAIMSDSHDHIWNLRQALCLAARDGAQAVVHCGDLVAPFMLKELGLFQGEVHLVFGNNDGDRFMLAKTAMTQLSNVTIHGEMGRVSLEDARICFAHERERVWGMLEEEPWDLACFGHTHEEFLKRSGSTRILNPGEVMGKGGDATFYLYNTLSRELERVPIVSP